MQSDACKDTVQQTLGTAREYRDRLLHKCYVLLINKSWNIQIEKEYSAQKENKAKFYELRRNVFQKYTLKQKMMQH